MIKTYDMTGRQLIEALIARGVDLDKPVCVYLRTDDVQAFSAMDAYSIDQTYKRVDGSLMILLDARPQD